MASKFDDMMAAHTPQFMDAFGDREKVWVTPFKVPTTRRQITAIILWETLAQVDAFQGRNFYNTLEIYISSLNNVDGIVDAAAIRNGNDFDLYEFAGKYWKTGHILEKNIGGMHKLLLHDGGSNES